MTLVLFDDLFSIRRRWFWDNNNIDITNDRLVDFFKQHDIFSEDIPGNNIFSYSNNMTNEQIDWIFSNYVHSIYDKNGNVIYIDTSHNPYLLKKLLDMDEKGDYAFQKNHHPSLADRINDYEKVTLLTFLNMKLTDRRMCSRSRDKIEHMVHMVHNHTQKKLNLRGMMMHQFEVELGFNPSKKRRFQ